MAIRCPGCGLEYDVALFQFGRTIDCTCGERVGLETRAQSPRGEPRFIADEMLIGLARWLRILGYDTACEHGLGDATIVRRCYEERRILLTRDQKFAHRWRVPDLYCVRADRALDQLEEIAARYDLRAGARLFTRCSRCNVPLEDACSSADMPAPIGTRADPITRCRSCGRTYWEGSHVRRMRETLEKRLGAR